MIQPLIHQISSNNLIFFKKMCYPFVWPFGVMKYVVVLIILI